MPIRAPRPLCSHVLEHVNDRLAIPELFRVVRPGGVLLAMVPLFEGCETSFEDPAKTATESERILYFNQHDHVRAYGRDFRARLRDAGFVLARSSPPWSRRYRGTA